MTSTLSGTIYALDFESSSTSTASSSPSSTSNSPRTTLTSTKKPRTRRKRLNQTYDEAATLLSAANPNLFPIKNLKKPSKFRKPVTEDKIDDSSEVLLFPFRACDDNNAPCFVVKKKITCQTEPNSVLGKSREIGCFGMVNSPNCDELGFDDEEFDCESILDGEIEEGIDSIMGSRVGDDDSGGSTSSCHVSEPWFGFGGKFGWARALRRGDYGNLWNFAAVDVFEISPGMKKAPPVELIPATEEKKKRRKKKEVPNVERRDSSQGLLLKLNYDDVRSAWSGSPFADDCSGSVSPGNDVTTRFSSPAGNKNLKRLKI